jgi:hypothetical protein
MHSSVPLEILWAIAGHPQQIADWVAMLKHFHVPARLEPGAHVEEIHTILGWPQRYIGRITQYKVGAIWAMATRPQAHGPCPLPHCVWARFEKTSEGSTLTIRCKFWCGGLLSVPLGPQIVKWFMKRTIRKLFSSIREHLLEAPLGEAA